METLVTIVKRANGNLFDLETTLHASWHTTTARSPVHRNRWFLILRSGG